MISTPDVLRLLIDTLATEAAWVVACAEDQVTLHCSAGEPALDADYFAWMALAQNGCWTRAGGDWPQALNTPLPRAHAYAQHEILCPQKRRLGWLCVAGPSSLPTLWAVQMAACAALLAREGFAQSSAGAESPPGCAAAVTPPGVSLQAMIENSKRLLQVVTDNVPAMLAYVDCDLRIVFSNMTYGRWYGFRPQELKGRYVPSLLDEERRQLILPKLHLALTGQTVNYEWCFPPYGSDVPCWKEMTLIPDCDSTGRVRGFVLMGVDIDERKKIELRLEDEARRDALTLLPNRRALLEALEHALARVRRHHTGCAVLFMDLNGFKAINDTHGHDVGDEVLKLFAEVLVTCVRETDTVARLAGDEFCVVLEGLRAEPEADIQHIVAKVHTHLARVSRVAGCPIELSSSVGVALAVANEPVAVPELISRADNAMYLCKRSSNPSGMHFYVAGDERQFQTTLTGAELL